MIGTILSYVVKGLTNEYKVFMYELSKASTDEETRKKIYKTSSTVVKTEHAIIVSNMIYNPDGVFAQFINLERNDRNR